MSDVLLGAGCWHVAHLNSLPCISHDTTLLTPPDSPCCSPSDSPCRLCFTPSGDTAQHAGTLLGALETWAPATKFEPPRKVLSEEKYSTHSTPTTVLPLHHTSHCCQHLSNTHYTNFPPLSIPKHTSFSIRQSHMIHNTALGDDFH